VSQRKPSRKLPRVVLSDWHASPSLLEFAMLVQSVSAALAMRTWCSSSAPPPPNAHSQRLPKELQHLHTLAGVGHPGRVSVRAVVALEPRVVRAPRVGGVVADNAHIVGAQNRRARCATPSSEPYECSWPAGGRSKCTYRHRQYRARLCPPPPRCTRPRGTLLRNSPGCIPLRTRCPRRRTVSSCLRSDWLPA
jgi:hypothetical protein